MPRAGRCTARAPCRPQSESTTARRAASAGRESSSTSPCRGVVLTALLAAVAVTAISVAVAAVVLRSMLRDHHRR
ncbi:SpdD protein [Streptomyces luteogriseus]|uniref:SpdD protein n=1 Tax=Streptomyces luteogriseus TaxID=68233 RepID=UPI00372097CB